MARVDSSNARQCWQDVRIWRHFDFAPAPNASGRFIGDHMDLVSRSKQFLTAQALSRNDPTKCTDVFALPLLPTSA
jgi:hypothetical protein